MKLRLRRFGTGKSTVPVAILAPSYGDSAAVKPGFETGTYASGQTVVLNCGLPVNSPDANGYTYTIYRNNVAIVGPTSSQARRINYVLQAGDIGKTISAVVTGSNTGGTSASQRVPGIYVAS